MCLWKPPCASYDPSHSLLNPVTCSQPRVVLALNSVVFYPDFGWATCKLLGWPVLSIFFPPKPRLKMKKKFTPYQATHCCSTAVMSSVRKWSSLREIRRGFEDALSPCGKELWDGTNMVWGSTGKKFKALRDGDNPCLFIWIKWCVKFSKGNILFWCFVSIKWKLALWQHYIFLKCSTRTYCPFISVNTVSCPENRMLSQDSRLLLLHKCWGEA